jgi:hypothetical protein
MATMGAAGRAAAAGIAAAACWAAAEQLAGRRSVRVSALLAVAVAMAGKSLPSSKTANLENRFNTTFPTVAANASAGAAGATNATSALAKLSAIASAGDMGATGGPYSTFGGATDGTTLKANINTTIGDLNDLAGDVSNIRARINQIYSNAS